VAGSVAGAPASGDSSIGLGGRIGGGGRSGGGWGDRVGACPGGIDVGGGSHPKSKSSSAGAQGSSLVIARIVHGCASP